MIGKCRHSIVRVKEDIVQSKICLDQMEVRVDALDYALSTMADALAVIEWEARIDAEFVLGGSPCLRRSRSLI